MVSSVDFPRTHIVEKDFGTMWLSNGILFIEYKPVVVDDHIIYQVLETKGEVCKQHSYPCLIDIRNIKYWTLEGRKMSFNHKDSFTNLTASAVVNSSPVGNILLGWSLRFMTAKIPVKLFACPEEGLKWLSPYRIL